MAYRLFALRALGRAGRGLGQTANDLVAKLEHENAGDNDPCAAGKANVRRRTHGGRAACAYLGMIQKMNR